MLNAHPHSSTLIHTHPHSSTTFQTHAHKIPNADSVRDKAHSQRPLATYIRSHVHQWSFTYIHYHSNSCTTQQSAHTHIATSDIYTRSYTCFNDHSHKSTTIQTHARLSKARTRTSPLATYTLAHIHASMLIRIHPRPFTITHTSDIHSFTQCSYTCFFFGTPALAVSLGYQAIRQILGIDTFFDILTELIVEGFSKKSFFNLKII